MIIESLSSPQKRKKEAIYKNQKKENVDQKPPIDQTFDKTLICRYNSSHYLYWYEKKRKNVNQQQKKKKVKSHTWMTKEVKRGDEKKRDNELKK